MTKLKFRKGQVVMYGDGYLERKNSEPVKIKKAMLGSDVQNPFGEIAYELQDGNVVRQSSLRKLTKREAGR